MTFLYDWMKNLVFYFILASMIMNLISDKKYQSYVRFFLGIMLIVIVMQPVLELFHFEEDFYNSAYEHEMDIQWEEAMRQIEQDVDMTR